MDKVHNVYINIVNVMVVRLIEVLADGVLDVLGSDVVEMALESVHESPLGLSHIVYIARFVCDAVNKVSTLTVYPGFG